MAESKLITCTKHGLSPGYAVCLHVGDGAKATYVEKATETFLGQAVCVNCQERILTVDDCLLLCAGCFAETQETK